MKPSSTTTCAGVQPRSARRCGGNVEEALDQLRAGGTVISRHSRVLNLAAHGGRLLTLQSSAIPLTPFGLVIEPEPRAWPAPGTLVRRVGNVLLAGALVVDLTTRQVVAPALPRASLSESSVAATSVLLRLFAQQGAFGPWWIAQAKSTDLVRAALHDRAGRSIVGLMRALGAAPRERSEVLSAALELMGLGPGGTPSGDDLLQGLMGAWLVFGPDRPCARDVAADLAKQAPSLTTRLAAEFYYNLVHGHVSEQLHELLIAVVVQQKERIAQAAAELGRFGATSGWDTVAGVHAFLLAHPTMSQHRRRRAGRLA